MKSYPSFDKTKRIDKKILPIKIGEKCLIQEKYKKMIILNNEIINEFDYHVFWMSNLKISRKFNFNEIQIFIFKYLFKN